MPAALRAWAAAGRLGRFKGQARVATELSRRLLNPGIPYRGADDLVLQIDPEDGLQSLMLLGIYDHQVLEVLRERASPGSTVVDAGAHLGYFTLHAARSVGPQGRVVSFECDPRVVPRLKEHVRLNDLRQVAVVEKAVSDAGGVLRLRLPGPLGHSTVHADPLYDAADGVNVEAVSLDEHLEEAEIAAGEVSLIKLDVEGAEAAALRGMSRTLANSSAALIVEIDPSRSMRTGERPEETFELLAAAGREPAGVLSPRGAGRITVETLRSGSGGGAADVLFLPAAQASSA
jgi:FkbM family methyltransferase